MQCGDFHDNMSFYGCLEQSFLHHQCFCRMSCGSAEGATSRWLLLSGFRRQIVGGGCGAVLAAAHCLKGGEAAALRAVWRIYRAHVYSRILMSTCCSAAGKMLIHEMGRGRPPASIPNRKLTLVRGGTLSIASDSSLQAEATRRTPAYCA